MGVAKWHDEGENRVLEILLGSTPVDGALYLGLYKDVTELGEEISLTDITEVSGFGYSRKSLKRGNWTVTDDEASYDVQTFLAAGGDWGNVTGYFIATSANNSGKLLASEHFDSAMEINDGYGIKISPRIKVS